MGNIVMRNNRSVHNCRVKLCYCVVIFVFMCGLIGCEKTNKVESMQSPTAVVETISPTEVKKLNLEYGENLCAENEEVLFSFKLENSTKLLSICISKTQPDYLVYRLGTKDKVELEFPEIKDDSWSKFNYDYYLRGGGVANEGLDLNYLTFEHDGYEYQVYEEYSTEDDMTYVGLKIIDKATNEETNIRGLSDSMVGSLITLREKM